MNQMKKYTFEYKRQEDLLSLLNLLSESSSSLSMTLTANVSPELSRLIDTAQSIGRWSSKELMKMDARYTPKNEARNNVSVLLLGLRKLSDAERIMPFSFFYYESGSPKLDFSGPGLSHLRDDNLGSDFIDDFVYPLINDLIGIHRLARGDKPYRAVVKDIEGEERIEKCKLAALLTVPKERHIESLGMKINPRIVTRDHYYDIEECDAKMYASRGEIDFEIKDTEDARQQLFRFFDENLINVKPMPSRI